MSIVSRIFSSKKRMSKEPVDKTPVTIPVYLRRSESMDERIRRIVDHTLSKEAERQGLETIEEANDFDIDDDPVDPQAIWEHDADQAYAQAVQGGIVEMPSLTPEKHVAAKSVLKKAREKANKQFDIEDVISQAIQRGIQEGLKEAQKRPPDVE